MAEPDLSVVIPVFNRQDQAVHAVESVFEQGFDALEIILVDDGSQPAFQLTPALVADPRIRLIRHGQNSGAAAARNTGMRAARGQWLAFLDSDDRWLPGTLEPRLAQANAASRNSAKEPIVYVAGFNLMRSGAHAPETRLPVGSGDPLHFASGCWFCPGSTALFRRDDIIACIGNQDENLRRFEDNDWFLRLALAKGRVECCPVIAAEIDIARKPSVAVVEKAGAAILKKYATLLKDSPEGGAILRRLRAWYAFELASAYWYAGRKSQAVLKLLSSFLLAPRMRLHIHHFWPPAAQSYAKAGS